LAGFNYFSSEADLCLFIKMAFGYIPLSFVIIYAEDGGIIGTTEGIKEVSEALSKSFIVRTMGEMDKFVGLDTTDIYGVWIHQTKLLKNLKDNFKDLVRENTRVFKTPSAPNTLIMRTQSRRSSDLTKGTETVQVGVGNLLYLVQHSGSDKTISVRQLSKLADGATGKLKHNQICNWN
jgi:hypothetical protein